MAETGQKTAATQIVGEPAGAGAQTRVANLGAMNGLPDVGDKIGKYIVERVIGSGGMGIVVAAKNEALDELVAIKLLRPKAATDKVQSERFAREARATVRIKSEHVVRIIDAGTESDAPYIVMEYLVGRDLSKIVREQGPLHPTAAVDAMLQVSEAVAAAHALGIIHRDLKPSNFFVTHRPDGSALVKVLDFGISKALAPDDPADPKLTETQAVFGSPTYMSPEQIRSAKHVDQRSDIWSLGVALFELITGRLPFMAENVPGLLASIVADEPFPLSAFATGLPEGLEEVILACLIKDPARRVGSVAELAFRLAPFASSATEASLVTERIERISRGAAVYPPAMTTGSRLAAAANAQSRPSAPAPPVAFGRTDADLSATGPAALAAQKRNGILLALAVGMTGLALVLVGSAYAYRYGRRQAVAPEIAPAAATSLGSAIPSTEPSPGSSPLPPPMTASAAIIAAPSSAPPRVTRPGGKAPRGQHPPGPTTAAPAPPSHDPAGDRY